MGISDIRFGRRKPFAHTYPNRPDVMYINGKKGNRGTRTLTQAFETRLSTDKQVRGMARVITHEDFHHLIHKAAGSQIASRALDNTSRPWLFQAVWKSGACSNCGKGARHHHGMHGCCGGFACHKTMQVTHIAGGERGASVLMNHDITDITIGG